MSATLAARAHTGSSLSAPVRRAAPARRQASWLQRMGRVIVRRPGRAVVLVLFSAVATAILVNAMLFQKGRHPAPIISATTQTPPVRSTERRADPSAATPANTAPANPVSAASAPMPPARPSDLSQGAREAQTRPPAGVTSIPRTAVTQAPAAPAPVARSTAARDPIADLINGSDIRPPAEIRGGAAGKSASARRTVEN